MAALIVGAVCAVILATTGQAAATEARVLRSIDEVGIHTVVVRDPTGQARIDPGSVEAVARLPGVEWAIGFGPVDDVRNAELGDAGNPVPSRTFFGSLPAPVDLTEREYAPDQAIAGPDALASLGASQPALGVTGSSGEAAVVGGFDASAPLDFLDGNVLVAPDRECSSADAGSPRRGAAARRAHADRSRLPAAARLRPAARVGCVQIDGGGAGAAALPGASRNWSW